METEKRKTEFRTPEFRVSYPAVFEPKLNELAETEKYEYSVQALFPKDTTNLKPFKRAMKAAIETQWPDGKLPKKFNHPIKDGDEYDKPETAGMWVINFKANEDYQPTVVSMKKDPETKEFIKITSGKQFYGGCWAHAVVNAYAYERKTKKGAVANAGVNFGLGNIQKLRDDEKFGGGGGNPETDFEDSVEDDTEEDLEF